jgi:hypothetical protein
MRRCFPQALQIARGAFSAAQENDNDATGIRASRASFGASNDLQRRSLQRSSSSVASMSDVSR